MLYKIMTRWFTRKGFFRNSDEIDQLIQAINEQSADQKQTLETFDKAMNNFATQRSLEACLEALNASMQIANIRGKLVEYYINYARLLEKEEIRLSRIQDKDSQTSTDQP